MIRRAVDDDEVEGVDGHEHNNDEVDDDKYQPESLIVKKGSGVGLVLPLWLPVPPPIQPA